MRRVRSGLAGFITLLTLVAFAMPALTVLFYSLPAEAAAGYDADCGVMVVEKAPAAVDHHSSKSDKMTDNCCISHHCCAAKMVFVPAFVPMAFSVTTIEPQMLADQHIPDRTLYGLDRPPKSLV